VTGHIRQRGPTTWELRVSAGRDPLTSRYRQITRTVTGNKTAAKRALAELADEVAKGRHTGTSATLGTLLDTWLRQIRNDRSPTTVDGYEGWITRDIKPRLGDRPLSKLEPSDLDAFYADLRAGRRHGGGGPLAPRSVRQVHAIIRAALQQAVRWRWLASNPALLTSPPTGPAHRIRPPVPADVLRLLEAMAERRPDLAVLLRVAAATGARRGELCALRWRHVDLERGVVAIEAAIIETGKGRSITVEKATKTDRERRVTVDPETVAILRAWRHRAEVTGEALGRPVEPADYVFHRDGDPTLPMRPSTVSASVRKLRDSLGLAGLRTHDLRHFQATQLLGQGESVRAVADRLGHADPALTLRVYAHAMPSSDQAAAAIMGRTLALPAVVEADGEWVEPARAEAAPTPEG
jgi:integrase